MKRKYKLTGCARFLIFMIIFVPIVWAGVSIYQGQNPVEQVKDFFNIESTTDSNKSIENSKVSDISILQQELKIKDQRIEELEEEIKELKNQLESGQ